MTALTQPLRDEHADILPCIDELREVADAVGHDSPDAVTKDVSRVHEFLAGHPLGRLLDARSTQERVDAMFEALHAAAHESLGEGAGPA